MRTHRHIATAGIAAATALAGIALAACGSSPSKAPRSWSAGHPAPGDMQFTDAEGLCAITVRYPDQAPGEIDYQGGQYIQRDLTQGAAPAGKVVDRSGDWTLVQPDAGTLVLVTPGGNYRYRAGANCGTNQAPPS